MIRHDPARSGPTGMTDAPPPVTGATRVRLHELSMRPDDAAGREAWVIGRVDTGDFITAPPTARQTITLLAEGCSVEDARTKLLADGADIDVADFVATLAQLGFLSHIDGHRLDQPDPPQPTLAWLRPRHVRWLLHPAATFAAIAIIAAAAVAMVADPALIPGYRDLLWSGSGGLVLLGNAAIGWTVVFLHELSHLATARGANVYARMSLSTRLQFLVAQTDVSGIWAAPRRVRLTVYLAGITTNLVLAAACVLAQFAKSPAGPIQELLAAAALLSLISVPAQFLVFMRTDIYFLIQDLTGCANLYADGSAFFRYHAKRLRRLPRRIGPPPIDPSRNLPARERRAVRGYTLILVAGTAICLSAAAAVTWPTAVTILARAIDAITDHGTPTPRLFDAITVLTITGALQLLWMRAWWRRHGHQTRRLLSRRTQQTTQRR